MIWKRLFARSYFSLVFPETLLAQMVLCMGAKPDRHQPS